MLDHDQVNAGTELALLLVKNLSDSKEPVSDDLVGMKSLNIVLLTDTS